MVMNYVVVVVMMSSWNDCNIKFEKKLQDAVGKSK